MTALIKAMMKHRMKGMPMAQTRSLAVLLVVQAFQLSLSLLTSRKRSALFPSQSPFAL
ncbi:MAG: hypothetical protein ABJK59_04095 [Erythrobacter sp.]|uniref:hypothetical protein n=1 Tax=Erythrobacter sp. TaxID=1042 RepID=UPI003298C1B7